MLSKGNSTTISDPNKSQAIRNSFIFTFFISLLLLGFNVILKLNLGFIIFVCNLAWLILFIYFDNQELPHRISSLPPGYYPPENSYFKNFLIFILFFNIIIVFIQPLNLFSIFFYFFALIISAIIAVIPYYQTFLKNQRAELDIQKSQLLVLSNKIEKISNSVSLSNELPNNKSLLEKSPKSEEKDKNVPENNLLRIPMFDSQTGKPLTNESIVQPVKSKSESEAIPTRKYNFDPKTGKPLNLESKQIRNEPSISQTTNNDSTSLITTILEGFSEKFTNYLFLGSITFIIIAILTWFFVFVPGSNKIITGPQTWIAGDSIVFLGVIFIIISETILTRKHISDVIPLNYLGIGIGLAICILGLLSIRFGVMPTFLSEFGFVNKDYLFLVLSILISSLSWIYAWRSPYRDLIFGSLISGFLIIDYSLQSQDLLLDIIGISFGIFFIFSPGIHSSWSELTDNRFLLGGLIVYDLLLLKTDSLLVILKINQLLYMFMVMLPIIIFIILFSLQKISSVYLWLCLPSSALILLINELAFINHYISDSTFSLLFITCLIIFAAPQFIFKNRVGYTFLDLGLNICFIFMHIIIVSLSLVPINSWYVILIPAGINILILVKELLKVKIKLGYLIVSYYLTIIPFGIYANHEIIFICIILISLILTILVFIKEYQSFPYSELYFMIGSLSTIGLGSIFNTFTLTEVLLIPFIIPLFIMILLKTKNTKKDFIHPIIVFPMLIQVLLTFTQSIFSQYIFYEYVLVSLFYGIFLVLNKNKSEIKAIYWFVNYLGFIGLFIYAEYNLILDYTAFTVISLISFVIIVLYIQKFSTIRTKQLFYDGSNFLLFFGLFCLVILEQFQNEYFLIGFIVLLLCTIGIDCFFLRKSGIDFTLSILFPSFLIIGKELFITQFLSQEISLIYAVFEFLLVALFGSIISIFSKYNETEESLISPGITSMFSIELVLIVLFVNKSIIDYYAISSTIILLILIILVIFFQRLNLYHFEYCIIISTSIILALVIPLTKNIDKTYDAIILFTLPIYWVILRFKIKRFNFVLDTLVYGFLVIAEYVISLELPNSIYIQLGLLSEQLIIIVSLLSIIFMKQRLNINETFYAMLTFQIPLWMSIGIIFDLELNTKVLFSQFTAFQPMTEMIYLKIFFTILFLALGVLYFKNNFEEYISQNLIIFGTFSYSSLGIILFQLVISQVLNNSFFNGISLIILLLFIQILVLIGIKREIQIQMSNQIIFFSSFYIILTIIVFLVANGLISGLLAILGTFYLLMTKAKNVQQEIKYSGIIFLTFGIFKIIFDIIYNFDSLLIEIAVSSSIFAICLLLLALVFSNKNLTQNSDIN